MKVVKLSLLKIHPDNAWIYSPTDLKELENSISSFGLMEPLSITKTNTIIPGHRRFAALKDLGAEELR